MVSFKVQHRSSSSSFRAIAALLIALTFRLCCFDVVTVEAYALRHRSSGSGDDQRLLLATTATTLADAHNLIASTASAAAETSAAPLTVNLDGSPKVCAFRLHRLADAPFDNHITVLMPVRGPTFVRRQAYMLNKLEARFRHAGYTHVQFVIVYAVELEEEEERPAVEVASNKMNSTATTSEAVVADEVSRAIIEDHFERVDSVFNVTVLRRTVSGFGGIVSVTAGANGEPINIEKLFRPSAAYVFDACGRFAYLIYSPWSSIQRPYIKASILSTMYDAPCGQCEVSAILRMFVGLCIMVLLSYQIFPILSSRIIQQHIQFSPQHRSQISSQHHPHLRSWTPAAAHPRWVHLRNGQSRKSPNPLRSTSAAAASLAHHPQQR